MENNKELKEEYKIIDDFNGIKNNESEEYKILDDEEDLRRKEVIGFVEDLIEAMQFDEEDQKKEEEHGKLLGIVGEMQFCKDPLGNNVLCFLEPTKDFCFTGRIKQSISYAKRNGMLDKDFLYDGFQASMMMLFIKNNVKDQSLDVKELYDFLKTDIERGTNFEPNVDLLFRKNQKTQNIDVYLDIRCGDELIKEEVPFKNVNRVCKEINIANQNYEKKSSKSFDRE